MKRYVGVDLHRNSFMVCYLNSETGEKEFRNYALSDIGKFIKSLSYEDEVAVETTTNTRYFKKKVEGQVSRVVVIDPFKFK
ncbi:MAG: IS110 family transposase, partial [Brevinematia bacterium]